MPPRAPGVSPDTSAFQPYTEYGLLPSWTSHHWISAGGTLTRIDREGLRSGSLK